MIATHLGFYNTVTTRTHVRFQFSTHNAAGANVAPNSAFEAADLRIYRANDGAAFSATQRSSANGITMTSPFDSLTGFHDVDIDLTDNTDTGFYAAGYQYAVVLAPDETVDGQTLTGVVLAYFEIGRPQVDVREFVGTAATASGGRPEVNTTHAAGTAWGSGAITAAAIATGAIDADAIAADAITAAKIADGAIDANTFATGAITATAIAADAIGASELAADAVAEIADAVWDEDATGHQTQGTFGQAIGDPAADANTIFKAVVTDATGATVGVDAAAILADTGTDGVALAANSITAGVIANGAIDAATFAADVDAEILSYVVDDATRIDASALNTLSGHDPGETIMGATDLGTGSGLTSLATQASVNTIDDFLDTEMAATLAAVLNLVAAGYTRTGTAQGGAAGSIDLDAGASSADDFYNNQIVVIASGTGAGQARFISDYTGSTRRAAVTTWVTNPDNTSVFYVLPFGAIPGATAPTAAEVRQEMDSNSTQLAKLGTPAGVSISADIADVEGKVDDLEGRLTAQRATNLDNLDAAISSRSTVTTAQVNSEVDTALADVGVTTTVTGRIDAAVSSRLATAGYTAPLDAAGVRSAIGLASANLDSQLSAIAGYIDTEVAAIVSAIAALNNISTAQVLAQVEAALAATLEDSIPSDGTRPSISSGIYMLVQFMLERSVSGTTCTVRKPDGSTTLFELTLNDAAAPTSITRT